jgi:hypothetical protein
MTSLTRTERDITIQFNTGSSEEHRKVLSRACDVAGQLFTQMSPAQVRIEITAARCGGVPGDRLITWNVFVTDHVDLSKAPPASDTGKQDE